jgi:hypothetical protein
MIRAAETFDAANCVREVALCAESVSVADTSLMWAVIRATTEGSRRNEAAEKRRGMCRVVPNEPKLCAAAKITTS